MDKEITAEMMRGIAKGSQSDIENIKKEIHAKALSGEYECWIYSTISEIDRETLKELGFKVGKTQWDRNESLTNISWHKK